MKNLCIISYSATSIPLRVHAVANFRQFSDLFLDFCCCPTSSYHDSRPSEHLSSAESIILSLSLSMSSLATVAGNAVVLQLLYKNAVFVKQSLYEQFPTVFQPLHQWRTFWLGLSWIHFKIFIRSWIQPRVQNILFDIRLVSWVHTTAATAFNVCCVSVDLFFPFDFLLSITIF